MLRLVGLPKAAWVRCTKSQTGWRRGQVSLQVWYGGRRLVQRKVVSQRAGILQICSKWSSKASNLSTAWHQGRGTTILHCHQHNFFMFHRGQNHLANTSSFLIFNLKLVELTGREDTIFKLRGGASITRFVCLSVCPSMEIFLIAWKRPNWVL